MNRVKVEGFDEAVRTIMRYADAGEKAAWKGLYVGANVLRRSVRSKLGHDGIKGEIAASIRVEPGDKL